MLRILWRWEKSLGHLLWPVHSPWGFGRLGEGVPRSVVPSQILLRPHTVLQRAMGRMSRSIRTAPRGS